MTNETASSSQSTHDALQSLKEALQRAYDNSKSQAVRDLLDERLDVLDAVLTKLNQADMASRTAAFEAAEGALRKGLKQLDALKARLQAIADDVARATAVVGDVDKVLSVMTSHLGL